MAVVPEVASVAEVALELLKEWEERNAHGEDYKQGSALVFSVYGTVLVGLVVFVWVARWKAVEAVALVAAVALVVARTEQPVAGSEPKEAADHLDLAYR